MLEIIQRIAAYKLRQGFNCFRVLPLALTFNITNRCNLKCRICNIWKGPTDKVMTLEEYIRIFRSVKGRIPWIVITGGEPFLREDIDLIIQNMHHYLKPYVITIATNGTVGGIDKKINKIVELCDDSNVMVNVSIDGIGVLHDYIRGKEGSFVKVMESYYKLKKIKNPNFILGVNTVISRFNADEAEEIFEYCLNLEPDSYVMEFAEKRDELNNLESDITPSKGRCLKIIEMILGKLKRRKRFYFPRLIFLFRREYYRYVKKILLREKQIMPCFSGIASGHISANGDVKNCCVHAMNLGNLREQGYDFRKVWFSEKSKLVREQINSQKCYCTSASNNYINFLCNSQIIPKLGLAYLFRK